MVKIKLNEEANIVWSDDPDFKKKSKEKKAIEVVPNEIELHIRLEKKGRGGKTVTSLYNFPIGSEDYFKKLTKKIKKSCGAGGTYKGESIEVQGDHKENLKNFLSEMGFKVKFTGA